MIKKDDQRIRDKTIDDFGAQFEKFSSFENDKYWADLDVKRPIRKYFSF